MSHIIYITYKIVCDANPSHYPKDRCTPQDMLDVDLENANDDPEMFCSFLQDNPVITGELI